jgi:hypothetical protein
MLVITFYIFSCRYWRSYMVFKDRQQNPPHLAFARPRVKLKTNVEPGSSLDIWTYKLISTIPATVDFAVAIILPWAVDRWNNLDSSHCNFLCWATWVFDKIFKRNYDSCTPQVILSDRSVVFDSSPRHWFCPFSPISTKAFCGAHG